MAIYLGDKKVGVSQAATVINSKFIPLVTKSISTVTANDLEGATSIGSYAFYGCGSLTSITLPDSVTSIGYAAFKDCSELTSVIIPNNVTSIADEVFWGCNSLTSVTIENGITRIGNYAFYRCSNITSILIPNSVKNMGKGVFAGCTNLTSITVSAGNSVYHSASNCLIKTQTKTIIAGCKTSVIPNDGSVTSIDSNAFASCSGLTSITIPNSVTRIGMSTFAGCTGLTSVSIPDSVTSIGEYAFSGCSGLTSITIKAAVPPTLSNVNTFQDTNSCPIYVPAASVDAYKTANTWSDLADRIEAIPE